MRSYLSLALIVCTLCTVCTLVSAVPPVTTVQQFPSGLTLEYPNIDYTQNSQNYMLHVHVFNSTGQGYITNSSATCYAHLYNSTGNHLLEEQMGFDSNGYDFELLMDGGNFTNNGIYAYLIFCNTTDGAVGYTQKTFEVTTYGTSPDLQSAVVYGILLFITLILFIGSFLWFNSLQWEHYTGEEGNIVRVNSDRTKKIITFFTSYILLLFLFFISKVMTESMMILNNTSTVIDAIFMFLLVGLAPITICVVALVILTTISDSKLQEAITRGF